MKDKKILNKICIEESHTQKTYLVLYDIRTGVSID